MTGAFIDVLSAVRQGARTRSQIRSKTQLPTRTVDLTVSALMFRGLLTTNARGLTLPGM